MGVGHSSLPLVDGSYHASYAELMTAYDPANASRQLFARVFYPCDQPVRKRIRARGTVQAADGGTFWLTGRTEYIDGMATYTHAYNFITRLSMHALAGRVRTNCSSRAPLRYTTAHMAHYSLVHTVPTLVPFL
jgi:hypothetical protein